MPVLVMMAFGRSLDQPGKLFGIDLHYKYCLESGGFPPVLENNLEPSELLRPIGCNSCTKRAEYSENIVHLKLKDQLKKLIINEQAIQKTCLKFLYNCVSIMCC